MITNNIVFPVYILLMLGMCMWLCQGDGSVEKKINLVYVYNRPMKVVLFFIVFKTENIRPFPKSSNNITISRKTAYAVSPLRESIQIKKKKGGEGFNKYLYRYTSDM